MPDENPAALETANPPAQTTNTGGASGAPSDSVKVQPSGDTGQTVTATLAEGGGSEDKPVQAPANWPDNWRDIASGGDQKIKSYLSRYNSPSNVVKALLSLRAKMDAGEIVRSKPEGDANDPAFQTQLNEWRAQAGIPEKPEGYLEKLPNGLVIGENDKPLVESFTKHMHGLDAPPQMVHAGIQWYYDLQEKMVEERANADKANRAQVEDELRSEWGSEYRANLNNIHSLFSQHGSKELLNEFFSARMADGKPLGDHPGVLKFLASVANELNPHGTVTPIEGQTPIETIATEKAKIEVLMRDNKSSYWTDTAMQKRYLELLDAEDRYQQRKAS